MMRTARRKSHRIHDTRGGNYGDDDDDDDSNDDDDDDDVEKIHRRDIHDGQ